LKKKADDLFTNLSKLNEELIAKNELLQSATAELSETKALAKSSLEKTNASFTRSMRIRRGSGGNEFDGRPSTATATTTAEHAALQNAYQATLAENNKLLHIFAKDSLSKLAPLRGFKGDYKSELTPLATTMAILEGFSSIPKLNKQTKSNKPQKEKLLPFLSLREQYSLLEECVGVL
jgi:hypothetical protein